MAVVYIYTGFTTRFRSGGTTWEACSGNLASWVPSQPLLMDTGKPRKTCVEVAGRRTFRILPSRQQSGYNNSSPVTIQQSGYNTAVRLQYSSPVVGIRETTRCCYELEWRLYCKYVVRRGTRWRSLLRHCDTSRKIAGSISGRTVALRSTQDLRDMNTSKISFGVKMQRVDNFTTFMWRLAWNLEASTFWNS